MKIKYLIIFLCIWIFPFCSNSNETEPIYEKYNIKPNKGYLPYPHHDPAFNQTQYDKIKSEITIINDFGLYQADVEMKMKYFHGGLDFVIPNGTKLFSLTKGKVVFIDTKYENYFYLVIEDIDDPNYGWGYAHINNIQNKIGDIVDQGQFIAQIKFKGLEHLHLNRIFKTPGKEWSDLSSHNFLDPFNFFEFIDTEAPTITKEIYFFKNNSDIKLDNRSLNGKIDIVIAGRDGGEYAHFKDYYKFGDRLSITKLEYSIIKNGIIIDNKLIIDFSKVKIPNDLDPSIIYKHYTIFVDSYSGDKALSYYILTNSNGDNSISSSDSEPCWDTLEKNSDGTLKYPDGEYTIEIRGFDAKGNKTVVTNKVIVKNN